MVGVICKARCSDVRHVDLVQTFAGPWRLHTQA